MTPRTLSLYHVATCASTQVVARTRLAAQPTLVHVVRADRQSAGQGRMGRTWQNPPGTALLLSIALREAGPAAALDGFVQRVVHVVASELAHAFDLHEHELAWDAPNDLVEARSSLKVAGVLADAVTIANDVRELRIGVGANLTGGAWHTAADSRMVTTIEAIAQRTLDVSPERLDALALRIAQSSIELVDH